MILASINTLLLWGGIGGMEWIWILLAVLLLFGGRKIPELARGIGKGIREFNDAKDGIKKEIEEGAKTSNSKVTENKLEEEKA